MSNKGKAVDYMILDRWDLTELKNETKSWISLDDGWQPSGGITVVPDIQGQKYLQTMVKYDNTKHLNLLEEIEDRLGKIEARLRNMKLSIF